MKTCPVCRQAWPIGPDRRNHEPVHLGTSARMGRRLERVGAAWTTVATGASRYYLSKLRRRYPGWEFRHEPINLTGDLYRIDARRRRRG